MKVSLINPKTGALKHAPVPASSLYSAIAVWVVIAVGFAVLAALGAPAQRNVLHIALLPIGAALSIFVTHRRLGKSLYLRGWRFADPDGLDARMARAQWGLTPAEAPSESASTSEPFVLDEAAFLADAAAPASRPQQPIYTPFQPPSGGKSPMRFVMYAVAVLAFAIGILCALSIRSDIQLGMSLTAFIGSFILLGLGNIMGRIAR